MNKEQRVLNIINRKPVDYLPSQITFSDRTRENEISKALGLESPDELDNYLENHLYISLMKDDQPIFLKNDIPLMRKLESKGYVGLDLDAGVVYDRWGMGIRQGEDGFFACYHPLQGNKEANKRAEKFLPPEFNRELLYMDLETAVKKYEVPNLKSKDDNFEEMEKELKELSGDFLVLPSGYFGTYERAYGVMGWEELMTEISINPHIVTELMDKITEYKIEVAKKKIAMGFKVAHHGDDLGTQTFGFFSKPMFREIVKPRLARLFKVYKDAGIPVALHSCGCLGEYLPDLIDIGLDIWEPVQPCNDLKLLKREYGKDLVFWGGIDTQRLPFQTPQEVIEMATEAIRILGKGGGCIVGPSQEIMNDVPLENVAALVKTIIQERERAM